MGKNYENFFACILKKESESELDLAPDPLVRCGYPDPHQNVTDPNTALLTFFPRQV
jgi:hypothetical protein